MLTISKTGQFKRDYKLCLKRGCDTALLKEVIRVLAIPAPLPEKNRDHPLLGSYKNYRECISDGVGRPVGRGGVGVSTIYKTGCKKSLYRRREM